MPDPHSQPGPAVDSADASPLRAAMSQRDTDVLTMVRRAIDRADVLLAFQPVVQAVRPDRPAFYEGLVRVLDEQGRIIPAAEFINAVETTETGRKLDCLALEMGPPGRSPIRPG